MNHFILSATITAVATFLLGTFVFFKKRTSLGQTFFWYSFAIAFWSSFVAFHTSTLAKEISLLFGRLLHVGAIFIPILFFHFTLVLTDQFQKWKKYLILSYSVGGIFLFLNQFTKLLINGTTYTDEYSYPTPGILYPLFFLFFVSLVVISLLHLYSKQRGATLYHEKRRMSLLLYSSVFGYLGGMNNFLITVNIRAPILYPYGEYAVTIYVGIMAYAILRYKFLDIEVIIKKTLIFAGLFSCVFGLFGFLLFVVTDLLQQRWGGAVRWWLLGGASAAYVLVGRRLEFFLVNATDRFLFQKRFDYRKILKYASEGLSRVNSLKYQLKLVTHFLTSRARIKSAAIYMPENGGHDFVLKERRSFDGSITFPERIAFGSQILTYLGKEKSKPYIELFDLEEGVRRYHKNSSTFQYKLPAMQEEMRRLNAHLVIPSFYQDELQGILVLGEKRSEEPYNDEDINLFQTIAQESAIAFENARKHDELVEQKEELARVNEELRRKQEEVIQAKEIAARAAISGGISHEVGNNILGLTGAVREIKDTFKSLRRMMAQWYDTGEPVSDAQKYEFFTLLSSCGDALERVRQTGHHIEDVVTTLSQIAKGKHAKMTRIQPRIVLKDAVNASSLLTYNDRLKGQAPKDPPELVMDRDLPAIEGNTELFNSVFTNLFKNAYHALKGVESPKIRIHAQRDPDDKNMVRIEFSDNGCGIPPEILPKIFDYGLTTKGAEGEGKGLYNVKMIIDREHKGKIDVQSEPGKGTTFIIKIPVYQEHEDDF